MTCNPIISAAAFSLLFPTVAYSRPPGPPPHPVVEAIDKNHDQEISSREIRNATKALLKLDEDDDKALSAEELQPGPPRRRRPDRDDEEQQRPPGPPPSPLVIAIDADGNGELSEAEVSAASEALLTLDRDDDGELSTEEAGLRRPGGPPPGGQGGPGGPPPGAPRR